MIVYNPVSITFNGKTYAFDRYEEKDLTLARKLLERYKVAYRDRKPGELGDIARCAGRLYEDMMVNTDRFCGGLIDLISDLSKQAEQCSEQITSEREIDHDFKIQQEYLSRLTAEQRLRYYEEYVSE